MDAAQAIDIAYGKGRLPVRAAFDLLAPRAARPIADETRAVFDALENPRGALPLREIAKPSERVAIVVNDITCLARADLLLPPILDTPNAAIQSFEDHVRCYRDEFEMQAARVAVIPYSGFTLPVQRKLTEVRSL